MTPDPAAQFTPLFESSFVEHVLPVLRPVAVEVGLRTASISIQALQVMYWLRNQHPIVRPELLRELSSWRWTGRNELTVLVAAEAAPAFVDGMLKDELLWEMGSPTKRLLVSPKGIALLARLHPAFADPELSLRYVGWAQDWPASTEMIARYLQGLAARQSVYALQKG
jgi:hypothetical protein